MDFLPMAIWCVGFLIADTYSERTKYQQGWTTKSLAESGKYSATVFMCGSIIFLMMGVASLAFG